MTLESTDDTDKDIVLVCQVKREDRCCQTRPVAPSREKSDRLERSVCGKSGDLPNAQFILAKMTHGVRRCT